MPPTDDTYVPVASRAPLFTPEVRRVVISSICSLVFGLIVAGMAFRFQLEFRIKDIEKQLVSLDYAIQEAGKGRQKLAELLRQLEITLIRLDYREWLPRTPEQELGFGGTPRQDALKRIEEEIRKEIRAKLLERAGPLGPKE